MKWHGVTGALMAGAMILPVASLDVAQAQQDRDRVSDRQAQPRSTQDSARESAREANQARQARQRGLSQRSDQDIEQILAADIKLGNEAEIQLSQLGQEQAQNPQVKQYARQMIQAHQQLNQALVQAVPQARQANLAATSGGALARPQPGVQTGESGEQSGAQSGAQSGTQATAESSVQSGEQEVYGMAAGAGQSDSLTAIHQQVHQNMLQQQKDLLQEHQGAEFDQAFMGCQIGLHQAMLAKLQVYQQHVPQDAQQVLQQAERETQQHLEEAKQIMRQLASSSN